MSKVKPLIPSDQLVKRLRLMAEAGGMLTKDRIEAIRQAADRIAFAFCLENNDCTSKILFDAMNNNDMFGGDER